MDLVREFFLEAFPNPERRDCPDEATLIALAERRLPSEHPACRHVASCSECFSEFTGCILELEAQRASRGVSGEPMTWSVIATSVAKDAQTTTARQRFHEIMNALRPRRPNHRA